MSPRSHPRLTAISTAALLCVGADAWAGPSFVSRQQLDAHVTKVDPRNQTLTLQTEMGKLKLEAPAAAADLEKGDPVLLEIAILPAGVPVATDERARLGGGADPVLVRRRLAARILEIDQKAGRLKLSTAAGLIRLDLPGNVLKQFKPGDVVPVELAVVRPPSGQALARDDPERSRRAGFAAFLFAIFGKNTRR